MTSGYWPNPANNRDAAEDRERKVIAQLLDEDASVWRVSIEFQSVEIDVVAANGIDAEEAAGFEFSDNFSDYMDQVESYTHSHAHAELTPEYLESQSEWADIIVAGDGEILQFAPKDLIRILERIEEEREPPPDPNQAELEL